MTDSNPALHHPASPPAEPPAPLWLGNVPLHPLTLPQVIDLIAGWINASQPRLIVTPNVDHIIQLQRNPEMYRVYSGVAALSLADGQPVMWAARYLGLSVPAKVSGSDLLPALCQRANQSGWRVFFVGGRSPDELSTCLSLIRQKFPGMPADGFCPPFGFERDPAQNQRLINAITAFNPQVICLGLGTPKSEIWLDRHAAQLPPAVSLSIGAGLRMLVGLEPRAPRWMQRAGFEWLWRLLHNPGHLWKRYLVDDVKFFPLVWRWKRNPPPHP